MKSSPAFRAACLWAGSVILFLAGSIRAQTPGSLDPTFNDGSGTDGRVRAVVVQPDLNVIVGGEFDDQSDVHFNGVARLTPTGALDPTFNPGTGITFSLSDSGVYAVALQADGSVIVAGIFDSFNGAAHSNIVRLDHLGNVDPTFNPSTGVDEGIRAVAVQADGKIIIGGGFDTVNGQPRLNLARLNADGSLDTAFDPRGAAGGSGEFISAIGIMADGRIVAGGKFNTDTSNEIVRFNSDSTVDATFVPDYIDNTVYSLAVQDDGAVVIGGLFQQVGETGRYGIARLKPGGGLDASYVADLGTQDFAVNAVAAQADGRVLFGGEPGFDGPQGVARLNVDGTLDSSYVSTVGGIVYALAVQPDNNAIVAGNIPQVSGTPVGDVARLIGGPLLTIIAPPPPPNLATVTITAKSPTAFEGGAKGLCIVTRDGGTTSDLTVSFTVAGNAQEGVSYKPIGTSVVIPAGSTTAKIKIKPIDDNVNLGTRKVKITLAAGAGYTVGSSVKAKVKIIDND